MDLGTLELPPGSPGEFNLSEVMKQIGEIRGAFLDDSVRFARFPTHRNNERLQESAESLAMVMHRTIDRIIEEDVTDTEKAEIITSMLMEDEDARVQRFNSYVGREKFKHPKETRDEIVDNAERAIGEYGISASDLIMGSYIESVSIDLDKLEEHSKSTLGGRALSIGRVAGKHSLEIAKISAGVAGGIWLGRRIKH